MTGTKLPGWANAPWCPFTRFPDRALKFATEADAKEHGDRLMKHWPRRTVLQRAPGVFVLDLTGKAEVWLCAKPKGGFQP